MEGNEPMDIFLRIATSGAGGAIGGAGMGAILAASGASGVSAGPAVGWGALIGLGTGVVASAFGEGVAFAQRTASE